MPPSDSRILLLSGLSLVLALCPALVLTRNSSSQTHNRCHDYKSPERGAGLRPLVRLPQDCGRFSGLFSGQPLAVSRDQPRIYQGYDAKLGQFPSHVELRIDLPGKIQVCGGTILTSRHVLTAAHCVDEQHSRNTRVGFGLESYMNGGTKVFEIGVERLCISPKFRKNEEKKNLEPFAIYDVAIIKLNRDIKFSDTVQPACLPRPGHPLRKHQQAFSIGLGLSYLDPEANRQEAPETLQVLPDSRVDCDQEDRHESVICHGPNNLNYRGGVCSGDSGGPLMALDLDERQTVYGVHSYSYVFCMKWTPDSVGKYVPEESYYKAKSADTHNLRRDIEQLLEECA